MKELLISKYIDDEMNLDEKVTFLREVKSDDSFYGEAIDLLKQEKMLSFNVKYTEPLRVPATQKRASNLRFLYPVVAAVATILLVLSITIGGMNHTTQSQPKREITYRFVYYNPSAKSVQITGSFTGWKKITMKRIDGTGYWQIYLKLPKRGIYQYNFIVNNKKIINDPTNPARIYNGFGGADSVLRL